MNLAPSTLVASLVPSQRPRLSLQQSSPRQQAHLPGHMLWFLVPRAASATRRGSAGTVPKAQGRVAKSTSGHNRGGLGGRRGKKRWYERGLVSPWDPWGREQGLWRSWGL